tara:strand:- start:93 stop:275 length:183 start_codon:yes stop_codon:yes gene_type:complete
LLASESCSFFLACTLMFLARSAYCSVDALSSRCCRSADTLAIITVSALPPSESCSRKKGE